MLLIAITVVIGLQVFFRFIMSSSLSWSEEVSRYIFLWITFLGSEIALRKKEHISLDFLFNSFTGVKKLFVNLFVDTVIILFCILLFKSGLELTLSATSKVSPSLGIHLNWVYMIIPITLFLMIINTIYSFFYKIYSFIK